MEGSRISILRDNRFRRITTSGRFIPEIDGLRFLAIGGVFVFHLRGLLQERSGRDWGSAADSDWLGRLADQGHYGVQLFFMISGFILGLPFALHHLRGAEAVPLRGFYARRLTRLEPPYLIAMALGFLLLVLYKGRPAQDLLPNLAASCAYLHNVIYGSASTVKTAAWSLEVEVQFYLLAPALGVVFGIASRRSRRSLLALASASTILLNEYAWNESSRIYLSVLGQLHFFLIGFLLVDIYVADWGSEPVGHVFWDAVFLATVPATILLVATPSLSFIVLPVVTFGLTFSMLRSVHVRRLLAWRPVATIGGMCYTIYLFHSEVMWVLSRLTFRLHVTDLFWVNLIVQGLVLGALVVIVSAVLFLLVEKPFMRRDWPRRLRSRVRRLVGREPPSRTSAG